MTELWFGRDSHGYFLTTEEPDFDIQSGDSFQVLGSAWFYINVNDAGMMGFPDLAPGDFVSVESMTVECKRRG